MVSVQSVRESKEGDWGWALGFIFILIHMLRPVTLDLGCANAVVL
jgi:hypothetical protein